MILLTANQILALREDGIISVGKPTNDRTKRYEGVLDPIHTNYEGYQVNTYYELYQAFRAGLILLSLEAEDRVIRNFLKNSGVESYSLKDESYAYYHPLNGLTIQRGSIKEIPLPVLRGDGYLFIHFKGESRPVAMQFPFFDLMEANELVYCIENNFPVRAQEKGLIQIIERHVRDQYNTQDWKKDDWENYKNRYSWAINRIPYSWEWAQVLRTNILVELSSMSYYKRTEEKEQQEQEIPILQMAREWVNNSEGLSKVIQDPKYGLIVQSIIKNLYNTIK